MSAQPTGPQPGGLSTVRLFVPPHPLRVAEYLEMTETEPGYSELVEGRLTVAPGPSVPHNHAGFELGVQLRTQLPAHQQVLLDTDVDLGLASADAPGTVRRPDLVVVPRDVRARIRRDGGILTAADVVLAVEILSPGSRRTDHVTKRGEYADAGIGHYWILDLAEPVSLLACHLAGEFGYADGGVVTGTYAATTPFVVELDLDALV